MFNRDMTTNAYDGETRKHTLVDGSELTLYWCRSMNKYVTIPEDDDEG